MNKINGITLLENRNEIINISKLLIYKEAPEIFANIDFYDDLLFLESLLFSYFNSKKDISLPNEILEEILQGYFIKKEKLKIEYSFKQNGIAYIPKLGYFKKELQNPYLPIQILKGTNIEVLKYSHPLIDAIFKSATESIINDSNQIIDDNLFNRNINYLTNAFKYIKRNSFKHFNLIEQCCTKCIMFKTNPRNTNSFATINAHGMAFFNVYQDDYDEVFFVDDIAHQTGHIIMTTLLFDRKKYFLIDETINIGKLTKNAKEYRSFYVLFHALYTYYTTFLCLDNCIAGNCFDKRQLHEAKGRIGLYLLKCESDLNNLQKVINHYKNIECVLAKDGRDIFNLINDKYEEVSKKYNHTIKEYSYVNQPYNFTFKEFIKLNPIKN